MTRESSDNIELTLKNHDGDAVIETMNRAEFPESRAYGTLDGHEVYVIARIARYSTPKLTVHAGGEYRSETGEYVDGESVEQSFQTARRLEATFKKLVEKHDLEVR